MKHEVPIDTRPFDVRIIEALEQQPATFDQLEARFWGEFCDVTKVTRNKIPRLDIEREVERLIKRGVLGVQNKHFFVRDPNTPAVGSKPYQPGSPKRRNPKSKQTEMF